MTDLTKYDTFMSHSLSTNTLNNATKFSYNSIQGHHHSIHGIEYYGDKGKLRWSMSTGCLIDPSSPASSYNRSAVHKRPILGTGAILGRKNILIISDLHLPYQHKDAFKFLRALEKQYQFHEVLCVGDLYDHHRGSYHESETNALSEEDEYWHAKAYAKELQKTFPKMTIVKGNHDNVPIRKLKTVGLPVSMLSDYNKMYDTATTWKWKDDHWFNTQGGFPVIIPMRLDYAGNWDKKILKVQHGPRSSK